MLIRTGQYEFVKRGDPPVVGITKLDGVTLEELKRPRRKVPLHSIPPSSVKDASLATSAVSPPEKSGAQ